MSTYSQDGSDATYDDETLEAYYGVSPSIHTFQPAAHAYERTLSVPEPFVGKQRYQVIWKERTRDGDRIWYSPNALSSGAMPTPTATGPVSCECLFDSDTRFGPYHGEKYVWHSDWYQEPDGEHASAAFNPDIFHGKGYCAEKNVPGLLRQWNNLWVEQTTAGFHFNRDTSVQFAAARATDERLRVALNIPAGQLPVLADWPVVVTDSYQLYEWWCAFARTTLIRRGLLLQRLIGGGDWRRISASHPDLHAALLTDHYRYGPRGAWVLNTKNRVNEIKEFVDIGVPVFYCWGAEFLGRPALRDLMPPGALWSVVTPSLIMPPVAPSAPAASASAAAAPQGRSNRSPPPQPHGRQTAPSTPAPLTARRERTVSHSPPTPERALAKKANQKVSFDEPDEDAALWESVDLDALRSPRHDRNTGRFSMPNEAETAWGRWWAAPYEDDYATDEPPALATTKDVIPLVNADDMKEPQPGLVNRMDNRVPWLEWCKPVRERPAAQLWVYDVGLAMIALRAAADHGGVKSAVEIVRFALRHCLRFATPIRVPDPQPPMARLLHLTPAGWDILDFAPLRDQVERWDLNVQALLHRPHALRAALMRGGIVARIARNALPYEVRFSLGPSFGVVDYGVPFAYRLGWNNNDSNYHDDYLTQNELNIILGKFKDATAKTGGDMWETVSFWPDENDMVALGYAHVWTETWERWYDAHRQALFDGKAKAITSAAWRKGVPRAVGNRDGRVRFFS